MECGESSPLCFLEKQSGEDSPHSIRSAISVTAFAVFDTTVCNYAHRHSPAIPYIHLVTALSARSGGTNSTPLLPHFRISRPRLINISFLFFAAPGNFF